MIAAMKHNDLRGVVQVRRFYLHCILSRISDYLKSSGSFRVSTISPKHNSDIDVKRERSS